MTEKTDAMAWEVGHDEEGFFTRTSHSPKRRQAGEYYFHAKQKFGDAFKPEISTTFDNIHRHFSQNMVLRSYLHATRAAISGEIFWKSLGKLIPEGMQFVGTAYDPSRFGEEGLFVAHTQISGEYHPYNRLGDAWINWDTDIVYPEFQISIDVFWLDPLGVYDYILNKMPKKWGNETEGYVLHCDNGVRVKIIDPRWTERRERIRSSL